MYSKVKLNIYKIKKYQQPNWLDFRVTIQNSKNSDDTSHLHSNSQTAFFSLIFVFVSTIHILLQSEIHEISFQQKQLSLFSIISIKHNTYNVINQ